MDQLIDYMYDTIDDLPQMLEIAIIPADLLNAEKKHFVRQEGEEDFQENIICLLNVYYDEIEEAGENIGLTNLDELLEFQ